MALRSSGFRKPSYSEALAKARQRQARARERGDKPARLKPGKKVREWDRERAKLKEECERLGIRACELGFTGCLVTQFLGFAHSKKRRNIVGDELREACVACVSCHNIIEAMTEDAMGSLVRAALGRRGSPECDSPSYSD